MGAEQNALQEEGTAFVQTESEAAKPFWDPMMMGMMAFGWGMWPWMWMWAWPWTWMWAWPFMWMVVSVQPLWSCGSHFAEASQRHQSGLHVFRVRSAICGVHAEHSLGAT